jgi:hypothetical protein
MEIVGWALSNTEKRASIINLKSEGRSLARIPIVIEREDIKQAYPGWNQGPQSGCGFSSFCSLLGLPERFSIEVEVITSDGHAEKMGEIKGQRTRLSLSPPPSFSPVMITFLPRSGSTLLLRMLSVHPDIKVIHDDVRCLSYWLHVFRVLAGPYEPQIHSPLQMFRDPHFAGRNPCNHPSIVDVKLFDWLNANFPHRMATDIVDYIGQFYTQAAKPKEKLPAKFFAEKLEPFVADSVGGLAREIWGERVRELVLFRDLRDNVASRLSFFLQGDASDLENDLEELRRNCMSLVNRLRAQDPPAYPVRYEDLIQNTSETLKNISRYVGLSHSSRILKHIMAQTTKLQTEAPGHVTSTSIEQSIGRWKTDLKDRRIRRLCHEYLDDMLEELGHDSDW